MAQVSLQQATERWVHNSLRANPNRIHGIMRAYCIGRQSVRWAGGLLRHEDKNVVFPIMQAFKATYPLKYNELMEYLDQQNVPALKHDTPIAT